MAKEVPDTSGWETISFRLNKGDAEWFKRLCRAFEEAGLVPRKSLIGRAAFKLLIRQMAEQEKAEKLSPHELALRILQLSESR